MGHVGRLGVDEADRMTGRRSSEETRPDDDAELKGILSDPPVGGGDEGNEGALRMNMWVRVRRGLVVAGLLLGVSFVGLAPGVALCRAARESSARPRSWSKATAASMPTPSANTSRRRPASILDADQINAGIKALYASGLFQNINVSTQGDRVIVTVVEAAVIDRVAFQGNHRMKDEQLQQEIQSKARGTLSRAGGAGRHRAHHRNLPAQRAIRRHGGSADHRSAEQPRRPDFSVNEGEKTGVKEIDLRRQSRLFELAAEGRDQDQCHRAS